MKMNYYYLYLRPKKDSCFKLVKVIMHIIAFKELAFSLFHTFMKAFEEAFA